MADRILMIDDDARLARMLAEYLGQQGFEVRVRGDARSGLEAAAKEVFDLILLDVMLPDGDGFEVCRKLRARSAVPIVMLTARGDTTDRVVGLELGADDYVAKPFEPRELLARVRARLRRTGEFAAESGDQRVLRFGALEVDFGAREARLAGVRRPLSAAQFDLLAALAERAGRVVSREKLLSIVGGDGSRGGHGSGRSAGSNASDASDSFDRAIDVQISRLRAALGDDSRHPRYVLTVRGSGYVLAKSPVA